MSSETALALAQTDALREALSQLRDIHLPVGETALVAGETWRAFASPGTLLAAGLALLVVLGGALLVRRWRQSPRQVALRQLRASLARHAANGDTSVFLGEVSRLLRQRAVAMHGASAAGLSGERWLHWLDAGTGKNDQGFQHGAGRILLEGPYRPPAAAITRSPATGEIAALAGLVEGWIRNTAA